MDPRQFLEAHLIILEHVKNYYHPQQHTVCAEWARDIIRLSILQYWSLLRRYCTRCGALINACILTSKKPGTYGSYYTINEEQTNWIYPYNTEVLLYFQETYCNVTPLIWGVKVLHSIIITFQFEVDWYLWIILH